MNVQYMQEFLALARTLNFTEAAKQLYISQPTLSNHVAALEKELGATLIARGEGQHLTKAGRVFVERAPFVLQAYQDLVSECCKAASVDCELTIVCPSGTGTAMEYNFQCVLSDFMGTNPNVYVNLLSESDYSVQDTLEKTNADCVVAFVAPPIEDEKAGILFEPVPAAQESQLGLWVDRTCSLSAKETLTWDDLDGICHPFAMHGVKIWETGVRGALKRRGISFTTRQIAADGINFMMALEQGDVQLFDAGIEQFAPAVLSRDRVLRTIEGSDAEARCYLGYSPRNNNRMLHLFLDFIRGYQSDVVR